MNELKKLKKEIIEFDGSDFSKKLKVMEKFKNIFNDKNNYIEKIKIYDASLLRNLSLKFGYFFEYWFYPEYLSGEKMQFLIEQILYDKIERDSYPSTYDYFIKNKIYDINEKIIYILIILYIQDIDFWINYTDTKIFREVINNNIIINHLIKNHIDKIELWKKHVNTERFIEIINNNIIINHLLKNHIDKIELWKSFLKKDLKKCISRKLGRYLMEQKVEYIDKFLPYLREYVLRKAIPYRVYKAIKKGKIDMKHFESIYKDYPDKRDYYFQLIEKYCNQDLSEYKECMDIWESTSQI